MKQFTFHPAADIFPLMEGKAFEEFKEDIRVNTQREPIVIFEGKILDGRNRYLACQELGIEPYITEDRFDIGDPFAFVLSENLHRRHLNESQRAMLAAKIPTIETPKNRLLPEEEIERRKAAIAKHGSQAEAAKFLGITQPSLSASINREREQQLPTREQVAKIAGVSKPTLSKAVHIQKTDPDLAAAIMRGQATVRGHNIQYESTRALPKTIASPAPPSQPTKQPDKPKSESAEELLRLFGDGKWHLLSKIAKRWDSKAKDVPSALRGLKSRGHIRYRQKGTGDAVEYMIHAPNDTALIPVSVIRDTLMPHLEVLQREGVRNPDLADTVSMQNAAWQIHWVIDAWGGEEGKSTNWTPGKPPPEVAAADKELTRIYPENVTPLRKTS